MNQKRIFTTRKNVLSVAVASCFGVVAGQALAVVDISVATPTGVTKYAKEIPSNTTTLTNASNNLDIKLAVPSLYAVSAANPLYVKLNLTQGARFAANPTLVCGTAAVAGAAAGTLQLGGAATSYAVFTVASSDTTMSGTCSAGVGNLTISGLNNVAVSATVEYKNGLNNTVTGLSNSYVTFVRGMSAAINSADGTVVVDATSGSDAFTTTSNRGVSGLATLGTVQWSMVGTSAASAGGVSLNVSAGDVLTTASVTVNGPAIAAALATNGNSGVFLDAAASACTTKSYTVSASATNSVTFNNVSLTDISAGVNVCINVSGSTQVVTTGQFTASVGGVAVSSVTADFSAASSALETVTANGVSRNAYFINASTSAAKTSVVRIINTGAVSATFTATAYTVDATGDGTAVAATVLGTANSTLGTLVAGGALSLTSAQLESKLGFTPGSGTTKYRVVISAGTDAAEVLNYTKDTATGAIVLSQSQTN